MPRDLYDVLGVPGTATEAEIRHAFWTLAKQYHPDVHPGDPDAARLFVEVGSAAETLLDPRRRAAYDATRIPARAAAQPRDAAPEPSPAGPAPTARAPWAATTRPTEPDAASPKRSGSLGAAARAIGVVIALALIGLRLAEVGSPGAQQSQGFPANGAVLWQTSGFSLDAGYGINLAGDGRRIQILPGMSTDIEFADGYLSTAGSLTPIPPGDAPTYQDCASAVRQPPSQAEPVGELTPGVGRQLCVSGSGGDLASVLVTQAHGSSITLTITVWEYV